MYRKKKFVRILAVLLVILFIIPYNNNNIVEAAAVIKKGQIIFVTTDTVATNTVKWKTIGFNICEKPTEGNPKSAKHATIMLSNSKWATPGRVENGRITITWTVPADVVFNAIDKAGLKVEQNKKLYINGIHQVVGGATNGQTHHTKSGIEGAAGWANNDDWKLGERFDVIAEWDGNDAEVSIEYQSLIGGKYSKIGGQKEKNQAAGSKFKTNASNIPNKKNGLQLYRVYYVKGKATKKLENRKTSINANLFPDQYIASLPFVRNRDFVVDSKGIKIVAIYRKFAEPSESDDTEEITKEFEEIEPEGVIAADERGSELFDVSDGIPGTETLYTNVVSDKYMTGYTFIRKFGTKLYPVIVEQPVTISYSNKDPITGVETPVTQSHTFQISYNVEREYSYWEVKSFGAYAIDYADIETDALGFPVNMKYGGASPSFSFTGSQDEKDHIKEPEFDKVIKKTHLTLKQSSFPTFGAADFKDEVEKSVKEIKCKNDSLTFNGQVLMTDKEKDKETDRPKELPDGSGMIGDDDLYKTNLLIPGTRANDEYETTGTLYYKPIAEIDVEDAPGLEYDLDLDDVVVHTPTVCDAMITDRVIDNQMISPNMGVASLILDLPFHVTLPTTGDHRSIKGYGYRDYGKYIASREVRYPFDVYRGSSSSGSFIPKNTWTSIGVDSQFYLPTWVVEGTYTINFRSTAINAAAHNYSSQSLANLELENAVATDTTTVEVSGRLYDFQLYDISDYPLWENVFRAKEQSNVLSGFKYKVGTKNQNGLPNNQNPKYTFSLVNGSHPKYQNQGVIKTGYVTRFSLKTIGSMTNDNDYIRITPKFHYIDKNGKNKREVDIYYSETFNGEKNTLVKMGSDKDLQNVKSIRTGDSYLAISKEELYQTSVLKGMTLNELKAQERKVWTYKSIMIPESLRTFVGYEENVPASVNKDDIAKSVQHWYGEYHLPSDIRVAPKDFDLLRYCTKNGALNMKENFWLKEGYVIVNFEIETIKNKEKHLSYINADNNEYGYCNMWNREGYQYEKVDFKGNKFKFQDGDYIMYYSNKTAAQDWISSGTH